jgi:uncharacterized protein YecE (DUF72 family)
VRCFVGTSGWIYPHWRGRFYPPDVPSAQWLRFLAGRFNTVELNATFYRLQRPECFARWRREAGPGFTFAVKASRYVTHMLKLRGGSAPLGNFFAQGLLHLGEQLGPILWQLPPQLGFSAERAESFFAALPRDLAAAARLARRHDRRLPGRAALSAKVNHPLRHALEVRHPSWLSDEALALLRRYRIALVGADSAGRFPRSLQRTGEFAYLRLHGATELYGSRYRDRELDRWAAQIAEWLADSDVYVYFDNDRLAYAPHDAQRLMKRLQGGDHAQHQGHH